MVCIAVYTLGFKIFCWEGPRQLWLMVNSPTVLILTWVCHRPHSLEHAFSSISSTSVLRTHTPLFSLSHTHTCWCTHWQWHTTDSCFTFYFVAVLLLHLSSLLLICITNTVFFKSPVSFIAIITNPITVILSLSVMQWFTSIKISWERSINIGCLNAHSPVAIKLKKTQ